MDKELLYIMLSLVLIMFTYCVTMLLDTYIVTKAKKETIIKVLEESKYLNKGQKEKLYKELKKFKRGEIK